MLVSHPIPHQSALRWSRASEKAVTGELLRPETGANANSSFFWATKIDKQIASLPT
jgi:hypothetical protein